MALNKQIRVRADDEQIRALGVYCLKNDTTPADILGDLLEDFLAGKRMERPHRPQVPAS